MGSRGLSKGRSSQTYYRKIKKMKNLYKNLYKASQKKKSKYPQRRYFCDEYPTVDVFLKTIKIKESNKTSKVSKWKKIIL